MKIIILTTFTFFCSLYSAVANPAAAFTQKTGMQFPVHTFPNLAKQTKIIPTELDGDYKLMIVAFQRWHQDLVDTWFPAGGMLEKTFAKPGGKFRYYEIPTIYEMGSIRRALLNTGMRTGVREQSARERTFTMYLDKAPFRKTLQIQNEQDIHLFLLNKKGKVIWRAQGKHSPEKEKALFNFVKAL